MLVALLKHEVEDFCEFWDRLDWFLLSPDMSRFMDKQTTNKPAQGNNHMDLLDDTTPWLEGNLARPGGSPTQLRVMEQDKHTIRCHVDIYSMSACMHQQRGTCWSTR